VQIPLFDGRQRAELQLDLDQPGWLEPKTPGEQYRMLATTLPPPFTTLFLKRFRDRKAPAHTLLTRAVGARLPASTPSIYGWVQSGSDYLYAFECLSPDYQTLNTLLGKPEGVQYMTPSLLLRVATQTESLFSAIGKKPYEHVYTDYCTKNMMYSPQTGGLVLIDLPSAWSREYLRRQVYSRVGGEFDIYFWTLWLNYPLARRNHQHHHLPLMMLLSFAAAFGRGLGLLSHPELLEAKRLLLKPATFEEIDQDPLWIALEKRREQEFRDFFLLPARPDSLFDRWTAAFTELTQSTEYVPWFRVRDAVEALAAAQRAAFRAPAAPVSALHLPVFPAGSANSGILTLLRTDWAAMKQVYLRQIPFTETELWHELSAHWQSRDKGFARANLVLLIHLSAGASLTFLSAITGLPIAVSLGIVALAALPVFRFLPARAGNFLRDLWATVADRIFSFLGFATSLCLPPLITLALLLAALPFAYASIRVDPENAA